MIELEILIPLSPLDYIEIKSYTFDINLYISLSFTRTSNKHTRCPHYSDQEQQARQMVS